MGFPAGPFREYEPVGLDDDVEHITRLRIKRARETLAALERIASEPDSLENIAALHELHARHLRELGDEYGAAHADLRARRVRELRQARREAPPERPI